MLCNHLEKPNVHVGKSQLICPSCEGDQAELAKELGDSPKAKSSKVKGKSRAKKSKPKTKAPKKAAKKEDKTN